MHTLLSFVAAALVCLAGDDLKNDSAKQEYGRFTGTWKFESVEVEGQAMPAENASLVLKDNKFTVTLGPQQFSGTYKVDVDKNPKQIDVTYEDGPQKGKAHLGIYELKGDTYKVCIGMPGKSRPTEFVTKPGSGHVLEVLKREKSKSSQ
jgi:uncharacterized protein (TIGR03067 family)